MMRACGMTRCAAKVSVFILILTMGSACALTLPKTTAAQSRTVVKSWYDSGLRLQKPSPLLPTLSKRISKGKPSLKAFPSWPVNALSGKRNIDVVLTAFNSIATAPTLTASEQGDGWQAWADGGFGAHRFIASKLSRKNYVSVLGCLLQLVEQCQKKYPKLYSVLKFIPKKNGLNPFLGQLRDGKTNAVSIEDLRPREIQRYKDDLQRTLEQCWVLMACYLVTPPGDRRDDLLWAAKVVVEKVKTDQRSAALELLCLGVFWPDAALQSLTSANSPKWPSFRHGFDSYITAQLADASPEDEAAARCGQPLERARMVYPFMETAYRAWLGFKPDMSRGNEESVPREEAIGSLIFRIAAAAPEDRLLNTLLYFVLNIVFHEMRRNVPVVKWDPQPYVMREEGVAKIGVRELAKLGHLFELLATESQSSSPETLLLRVKEVETTVTLLSSMRDSCSGYGAACPLVVGEYEALMTSPGLTLEKLEALEFDALSDLLGVDREFVEARSGAVRTSLAEWRAPELLFRYLNDNRDDERMSALIKRWLSATLGLSDETLRMIRRESPENVRHLVQIPQDVLLRWYSEECPGTSKCKTLFMLGEDANSCLRITSNDGNKYNKALLGYVLQSHVRALVVCDAAGRVLVRSLIRLLLRSDTLTPVIFCDPMFFTIGFSRALQKELTCQAKILASYMNVPVVHAGSVLPLMTVPAAGSVVDESEADADVNSKSREPISPFSCPDTGLLSNGCVEGGYARCVSDVGYNIAWVDLLEMDGIAPYTYSEELPYDDMLNQHTPGVQSRTSDSPVCVIAALPRSDSPSAAAYVAEREGATAWTMYAQEDSDDDECELPTEVTEQIEQGWHSIRAFDPNARTRDLCAPARIAADERRRAAALAAMERKELYADWELPDNFEPAPLDH